MQAEQLTLPSLLAVSSIPSPSVSALDQKLQAFAKTQSACTSSTLLSDALIEPLCSVHSRDELREKKSQQKENTASAHAKQILEQPIMGDALTTLADWTIYYAPLYDYMNMETGQLFENANAFLGRDSVLPRGPMILNGALQTVTVGLAQTNALYGDVTARMLFDVLWDSPNRRFVDLASIPKEKDSAAVQKAKELLASGPYFQRNLLMIALDRSMCLQEKGTQSGAPLGACVRPQTTDATKAIDTPLGESLSYRFALDWLTSGSTDSTAPLQTLFGDGWSFKLVWKSSNVPDPSQPDDDETTKATKLAQAVGDADQKCENAVADEHGNRAGCYSLPVAEILRVMQPDGSVKGIQVPLPSPEAFGSRELTYPNSVLALVSERDKVAAHLADYGTVVAAAKKNGDPGSTQVNLVKALIQTYR